MLVVAIKPFPVTRFLIFLYVGPSPKSISPLKSLNYNYARARSLDFAYFQEFWVVLKACCCNQVVSNYMIHYPKLWSISEDFFIFEHQREIVIASPS